MLIDLAVYCQGVLLKWVFTAVVHIGRSPAMYLYRNTFSNLDLYFVFLKLAGHSNRDY